MKKAIIILAALAITGCAGTQVYKAAPQNYRMQGEEKAIDIKGALIKDVKLVQDEFAVGIYFNDNMQIKFQLDNQLNGEGTGSDFNGKKTSATCTGRTINQNSVEVRCMVFIDNERTVTLTF